MILLSRLIKSQFTNQNEEKKAIAVQSLQLLLHEQDNHDDPELQRQASFILQKAKEEADQLIQEAQQESARIKQIIEMEMSAWEQEREQLIEQTRHEGYAEGLELGRQEALRQFQANIQESNRIIDLAKNDYDETIQSAEYAILDLSVKLAEKIMSATLSDSPDAFLPMVKKGLNEVKEYNHIKIHVHPSFYELVLNQKEELRTLVTNDTDFNIYANAELNEYDCFIESAFGRIDISIDTQLEQLKKQLIDLLDER